MLHFAFTSTAITLKHGKHVHMDGLLASLAPECQAELQALQQAINEAPQQALRPRYLAAFAKHATTKTIEKQKTEEIEAGQFKKYCLAQYAKTPTMVLQLRHAHVELLQNKDQFMANKIGANWQALSAIQTSQEHITYAPWSSLLVFEQYYLNLKKLAQQLAMAHTEFETLGRPILSLLGENQDMQSLLSQLKNAKRQDKNYRAYQALLQFITPYLQPKTEGAACLQAIKDFLGQYAVDLEQARQNVDKVLRAVQQSMWARYARGFDSGDITDDDVLFDTKAKLVQENARYAQFNQNVIEHCGFHSMSHKGMMKTLWENYHRVFIETTNEDEQQALKKVWKAENSKPGHVIQFATIQKGQVHLKIVPDGFAHFIPPASALEGPHPGKRVRHQFFDGQLYDMAALNQKMRALEKQLNVSDLNAFENISDVARLFYDIELLLHTLRDNAQKKRPNVFLRHTFLRETNAMLSVWLTKLEAIQDNLYAKQMAWVDKLAERPNVPAQFEAAKPEALTCIRSLLEHIEASNIKKRPVRSKAASNVIQLKEHFSDQNILKNFLDDILAQRDVCSVHYTVDSTTGLLVAKLDEAALQKRTDRLLQLLADPNCQKALQLLLKLLTGQCPVNAYVSSTVQHQLGVLFAANHTENVKKLLDKIAQSYLLPM